MKGTKTTPFFVASLVFWLCFWSWPVAKASPETLSDRECNQRQARVFVPGGEFLMGSRGGYPEERPVRQQTVTPFEMDATEVTNAKFLEFVTATGYVTQAERKLSPEAPIEPGSAVFISPAESGQRQWWHFVEGANWRAPLGPGSSIDGLMDHPVVHVSYYDALEFAEWAGGDLPTEAEWEFAARGGMRQSKYEWGEQHPDEGPSRANTWQGFFPIENLEKDGYVGTAPVGCYPSNRYGLYDMTGNVWEWTRDLADPGDENSGLIKGGSYLCADNFCRRYRPAAKNPHERDFSTSHIGFRLVYR